MTVIEYAEKKVSEFSEVGYCDDARYWLAYLEGAIDQKKESGTWISVKDMIPKNDERVLALYDDNVVRIGQTENKKFPKVFSNYKFTEVTHWMQIPSVQEVN